MHLLARRCAGRGPSGPRPGCSQPVAGRAGGRGHRRRDADRLIAAAEELADLEAARAACKEITEGDAAIPGRRQGGSRTGVTYRIEVAPAAVRQLRKLGRAAQRRVQAATELLATEPGRSSAESW
jgi:hypothetical protein